MTVDEVQKIIDEVDENRDGKLNYKEVLLQQQQWASLQWEKSEIKVVYTVLCLRIIL